MVLLHSNFTLFAKLLSRHNSYCQNVTLTQNCEMTCILGKPFSCDCSITSCLLLFLSVDCETCDYTISTSEEAPPDYTPAQRFPVCKLRHTHTHTTLVQHSHNTHTTLTLHTHCTHTTLTLHTHTFTQHTHNTHTHSHILTQHSHNTHTTLTQHTHNTHTHNTHTALTDTTDRQTDT